jgi:hypothetical protein
MSHCCPTDRFFSFFGWGGKGIGGLNSGLYAICAVLDVENSL